MRACIHPETYKYFLSESEVGRAWDWVEATFDRVDRVKGIPMIEAESRAFLLRAPDSGMPITVIRKDVCASSDIRMLHDALGFREERSVRGER